MISELATMDTPDWLTNADAESIENAPFPLKDVLAGALYYPSSAFDGDPVKLLAGNIFSFIYVDYFLSREKLEDEIKNHGFAGYELILSRDVAEHELTPNGWNYAPPKGYTGLRFESAPPFCSWLIFQRNDALSDDHGPSRFSLLYLCAEGVAAFNALYIANGLSPKAVAIIQPGTGFGGNWTNFEDPDQALALTVLGNVNGQPDLLLFGGRGESNYYRAPCWPIYNVEVTRVPKSRGGRIGVWKKGS